MTSEAEQNFLCSHGHHQYNRMHAGFATCTRCGYKRWPSIPNERHRQAIAFAYCEFKSAPFGFGLAFTEVALASIIMNHRKAANERLVAIPDQEQNA